MSTLPEQVQIECSECGADIIEDMEWVLEVGSENLICEDCYETEQEGYQYPESDPREAVGLTEAIVEIGEWLLFPIFVAYAVESIFPNLLSETIILMWGVIAGSYLTYFGYTKQSRLAAIIGIFVLFRSAIALFPLI